MGNSFAKPKEEDIKDITIDEGFLLPFGIYPSAPEDYDVTIVQRLIMERRLAPFYKGLPDADDAAEHTTGSSTLRPEQSASGGLNSKGKLGTTDSLGASSSSIGSSRNSVVAARLSHERQRSSSSLSIHSFKGKRSASLPAHIDAPITSYISLEELWKSPIECPICFLFYPRNINYSRCCEQPICTECFIQIKRPEATLEPSACPFCVEPNFGIMYHAPNSVEFRSRYGSVGGGGTTAGGDGDKAADCASVKSAPMAGLGAGPSATDVSGGDGGEKEAQEEKYEIRPDWLRKQQQLALVRAASQRRSTYPFGAQGSQRGRRTPRLGENFDPDLAGAAAAAAALVEGMSANTGSSGRTDRRRTTRRTGGGSGDVSFGYIEAMRNMGADLEELMIMEAVRRSLMEASQNTSENGEGSSNIGGEQGNTGSGSGEPSASASPGPATVQEGSPPANSDAGSSGDGGGEARGGGTGPEETKGTGGDRDGAPSITVIPAQNESATSGGDAR
ncbi:SNF1-interacting protein [Borealophlyctis nickersoniae]|nr:SNF1-interacting protein [Borealophlyctis nickersoniae]